MMQAMRDGHSDGWTRDLAERLAAEPGWRVPLGEALDRFYHLWPDVEAMAGALAEPPTAAMPDFQSALHAAVVEQLALQWGIPEPPWVVGAGYGLTRATTLAPPWFPAERLRGGPEPFARRLILTEPDPLRRARRPICALPRPIARPPDPRFAPKSNPT